jgi:putative colanic acid biosynthesis UDP-glucose lipid carrier transferase
LYDKDIEVKRNGFELKKIGNVKELPNILEKNNVDEIFISISSLKEKKIKSSIKIADNFGIRVRLLPEDPNFVTKRYELGNFGNNAVFQLRKSPLDEYPNVILKRLFDVVFAFTVLIFLSPILFIISLIIYSDNKGPVFYKPFRKGEAGYTFRCYKFRTMSICDDPVNGTKSTTRNDPRITTIGRLLRKSDLDELPQFFNVLLGNMSVVGPRPHRINLQNDFRKSVNNYMVRSYVKPGITGWAQVNGWRGPTITDKQKKQRVKHDLWYIENWSLWLDIKIIFMTIFGRHRKNAF